MLLLFYYLFVVDDDFFFFLDNSLFLFEFLFKLFFFSTQLINSSLFVTDLFLELIDSFCFLVFVVVVDL